MSYSLYSCLRMRSLKETIVLIQLFDRLLVYPKGVLKDVLVKVKGLIFPINFYVLDIGSGVILTTPSYLLLKRHFFSTADIKFDFYDEILTIEYDG